VRVLVIGESPVVRAGLEAAMLESDRFQVVGNGNFANSARLLESTAAEAVFMDAAMFTAWVAGEAAGEAARDAAGENTSDTASGFRTPVSLTPREIEVLRLLAGGTSNKVIAHKLGISDHTVKFHVTSILSKMNAGTRTEAVTLGVRMGLVYL